MGLVLALLVVLLYLLASFTLSIRSTGQVPAWADAVGSVTAGAAVVLLTLEIISVERGRDARDQPIFRATAPHDWVIDNETKECVLDFYVQNEGARDGTIDQMQVRALWLTISVKADNLARVVVDAHGAREVLGSLMVRSGEKVRFRTTRRMYVDEFLVTGRSKVVLTVSPIYGQAIHGFAVIIPKWFYAANLTDDSGQLDDQPPDAHG